MPGRPRGARAAGPEARVLVSSSSRVALSAVPRALTSLSAAAYAALKAPADPRDGGIANRWPWSRALPSANVAKAPLECRRRRPPLARPRARSVWRHVAAVIVRPQGDDAVRRRAADRDAILFGGPAGMPLKLLPSAVSNVACCTGNTFTSTS